MKPESKVNQLLSSLDKLKNNRNIDNLIFHLIADLEDEVIDLFYQGIIDALQKLIVQKNLNVHDFDQLIPYLNLLIYPSISSKLSITTIVQLDYIIQDIRLKFPLVNIRL